jgi:cytochrome oxidase Cu insertion factor (SCO1/SenC/PrrC family)
MHTFRRKIMSKENCFMPGRIIAVYLIVIFIFAGSQISNAGQVQAQTKPDSPQKGKHYVCPMHKEISSTKPANCSKCGMALRLVEDKIDTGVSVAANQADSLSGETPSILPARLQGIKVYDQNGNLKNFYTDLIKGKTVAINFIFTTCTTICPPLTATFRRVQKNLAQHAPNVQLISISVDPTTDTSERLHNFADKFGAEPGWTFVTGDQATIDSLLEAMGVAVANKNDHTPMILIGNDVTGYWTRAYGLSSPDALVKAITEIANRK